MYKWLVLDGCDINRRHQDAIPGPAALSDSLHDRANPAGGYEDVVFERRGRKRVAGAYELIFHLMKNQGY